MTRTKSCARQFRATACRRRPFVAPDLPQAPRPARLKLRSSRQTTFHTRRSKPTLSRPSSTSRLISMKYISSLTPYRMIVDRNCCTIETATVAMKSHRNALGLYARVFARQRRFSPPAARLKRNRAAMTRSIPPRSLHVMASGKAALFRDCGHVGGLARAEFGESQPPGASSALDSGTIRR